MVSFTAAIGLASFSAFLLVIGAILKQLGAAELAKGLVFVTGFSLVAAFAITYVPSLLLP